MMFYSWVSSCSYFGEHTRGVLFSELQIPQKVEILELGAACERASDSTVGVRRAFLKSFSRA